MELSPLLILCAHKQFVLSSEHVVDLRSKTSAFGGVQLWNKLMRSIMFGSKENNGEKNEISFFFENNYHGDETPGGEAESWK